MKGVIGKMTCPICRRLYCDHSPDERGQSLDNMIRDMYSPHIINESGETKRVTAREYEKYTGNKWKGTYNPRSRRKK